MAIRLLTSDYEKAVLKACSIPHEDYSNHFLNFADEYYNENFDLFEKLIETVIKFIELVNHTFLYPDNEEDQITCSVDESGEFYILLHRNNTNFKVTKYMLMNCLTSIEKVRKLIQVKKATKSKFDSKPEKQIPNIFDEIFIDPKMIEPCIDILRQFDKPVIDRSYNFIGKNKTIVCIWVEELRQSTIIANFSDLLYTSLLNQKFPGLDMTKDGSLFRKISKRAETKRKDIQVLLSRLSQSSLSGK
jgi:hypothetical protein